MASKTIHARQLMAIAQKFFGDDTAVESLLSGADTNKRIRVLSSIPLICIKSITVRDVSGDVAIEWRWNGGIYRVVDIWNWGFSVADTHVDIEAAAAFIYELYLSALSIEQMKKWVFEILPKAGNGYGFTAVDSVPDLANYMSSLTTL